MIDPVYEIKSYGVMPDVRGSPYLVVRTDKRQDRYKGAKEISSFITAVMDGIPCRVRRIRQTTPTGGVYYTWERVEA